MNKKTMDDIIKTMEEWFAKFPALPKNARDTLANIAPIIALIFGILGIIVALGGIGTMITTLPLGVLAGISRTYGTGILDSLFYLASSALLLSAYTGLKAKKIAGWNLLFWSEVVGLIGGVVSYSGIVSAIIGALIGFYILFQIKSYYK
jgi:hypothetical protein